MAGTAEWPQVCVCFVSQPRVCEVVQVVTFDLPPLTTPETGDAAGPLREEAGGIIGPAFPALEPGR